MGEVMHGHDNTHPGWKSVTTIDPEDAPAGKYGPPPKLNNNDSVISLQFTSWIIILEYLFSITLEHYLQCLWVYTFLDHVVYGRRTGISSGQGHFVTCVFNHNLIRAMPLSWSTETIELGARSKENTNINQEILLQTSTVQPPSHPQTSLQLLGQTTPTPI